MGGTERKYVADAFDTDWIVPLGPHVDEFERRLAAYLAQDKQLLALSAGTAAIHLALVCLGVGKDDEVVCQSLTFSASANPIAYQGARPVFVDSEPDTMNISPAALADALDSRRKATGAYPKAIVAVDLYGMPAKWDEIEAIASERGVPIVEDAAEALGSRYKGRSCGTFGAFGALSFNGNKIITTSGGGALICPDEDSRRKALFFATQARENLPYYYHKHIGFNYRLSNICGAIGCGQMEVLPERVARRQAINAIYAAELSSCGGIRVQGNPGSEYESNFWLTTVQFDDETAPERIRTALAARNIETRPLWRPMHMQPVFADAPYYGGAQVPEHIPQLILHAERLYRHGLCLPSGSVLNDKQIMRVCSTIKGLI